MPTPTRDDFQIGWICALHIELSAAILMLDEEFPDEFERDHNDTNTYCFGKIHNHYVVIACLPSERYGTNSAAIVATNMMRSFSSSLRIGLLVGVGAGAWSPDNDIRLGDIVVGSSQSSPGAVVQYDYKKDLADGRPQLIGKLNNPPTSLATALGALRARHAILQQKYPTYLQDVVNMKIPGFLRPAPESDRLFQADYIHPQNQPKCDYCSSDKEHKRQEREEAAPQVFYGTVASGNTVIKDAVTRDRIQEATKALCFEMEAAGLMNDFPCLVIRGICDYADSHKNKAWQPYAALAAAAYAKDLMSYIPRGQVVKSELASKIGT